MSVYKNSKSPFYQFDFELQGRRFFGSTKCTARKEAERYEAVERERAKTLLKAVKRSRASLAIDDVADRLWTDQAQYNSAPKATETNLERLIKYFGPHKSLTEIDHTAARDMVAWRRGHRASRRKDLKNAPLISNATVNRSATKVLQRLFTFARAEGAVFENEPNWEELLLLSQRSGCANCRSRRQTRIRLGDAGRLRPILRFCPRKRHATQGMRDAALVRSELRHQADCPHR